MTTKVVPKKRKLRGMRRTIARRMHESLSSTAQLSLHSTIEITELVQYKKESNHSYTDLFVKATALALTKHPNINVSLIDNVIHEWPSINIGLAVAVEDGLVVPTIENADEITLNELAEQRKDLVKRAHRNELRPEEVTSGTFTISNLGLYPIDGFTPILNPPQSALLGIGRIQELPRIQNNEIVITPVVHLSLTVDHQVIDGEPAAKFIEELQSILKHPNRLQ